MSEFTLAVSVRAPGQVRISEVQVISLLEAMRPVLASASLQTYIHSCDPELLYCIRQALAWKGEMVGKDLLHFAEYLQYVDRAIGYSGLGALFSAWRDAIHATGFAGIPDILGNVRRLARSFELAQRASPSTVTPIAERKRAGLPRYAPATPEAA